MSNDNGKPAPEIETSMDASDYKEGTLELIGPALEENIAFARETLRKYADKDNMYFCAVVVDAESKDMHLLSNKTPASVMLSMARELYAPAMASLLGVELPVAYQMLLHYETYCFKMAAAAQAGAMTPVPEPKDGVEGGTGPHGSDLSDQPATKKDTVH